MPYKYNPISGELDFYEADSGGTVTSVSGTADRITVTDGTADAVVDIASTYTGQNTITTLGTVATGTWNADVIGEVYGGTAQSTYATGDTLYASGANTLSKLTAGNDGEVLTLASGVPSWAATSEQTPTVFNIGISYSAGTFTVHGANGTALSASNPGYVTLQSKASPGQLVQYTITANQTFVDDAGASEIIGNLFGFTTSVAITVDVPFFLYAVGNDNEDTIAFMLSRHPHRTTSPAAADIGAPDDPVADQEGDFWSLENLDETLYDSNPCNCIGSFRMRMSASDDWTVQTLDNSDGIGQFQESTSFTQPTGQFGANSGTITIANGGTAAVFSSSVTHYYITKSGYLTYYVFLSGDGGTDGSGAVPAVISTPFVRPHSDINVESGGMFVWAAGNLTAGAFRLGASNTCTMHVSGTSSTGTLNWANFSAGARSAVGTLYYKLSNG